jgi:hypothetical protein
MRRCTTVFWLQCALLLYSSGQAWAQLPVDWVFNGTADYRTDGPGYWSSNFIPAAQYDEVAVIANGGTAYINGPAPDVGAITLGGAANTGTLEVRSGGSVVSRVSDGGFTTGLVTVGNTSRGTLIVQPGGTLQAASLTQGGAADSRTILGGTTAGTATLTVNGAAAMNRVTQITGPNVVFTASSWSSGAASQLIETITGDSHSKVDVSGTVTLGGTLKPEFIGGVNPALGDSWTLFDASSIVGNFATIDTTAAPPLSPGLTYRFGVANDPMSAHGQVGQLTLGNSLVFQVSRATGVARIKNYVGTIDFDAYSIGSASGSLSTTNWSSFQDQAIGGWLEANPTATHLTETNLTGSSVFAAGVQQQIGQISDAPSMFPQADVDAGLSFQYHTTGGATVNGLVEPTGPHNNIVLVINPETGTGWIQNQSAFDVSIDAYSIGSASGSLSTTNWSSFQDQAMGSWLEANPTANRLTETNLTSMSLLGARGAGIAIGMPFSASTGSKDLTLEFHLAGGATLQGVVDYATHPFVLGDANDDGVVNIFDINLVSSNWGTAGPDGDVNFDGVVNIFDINLISSNWGSGGGGSGVGGALAAVPEPTAMALCGIGCICLFVGAPRRRQTK